MPWKDQLRLGWSAIRWVFWPKNRPVWANTANQVVAVAVAVAIGAQVWLAVLAGVIIWVVIAVIITKGN